MDFTPIGKGNAALTTGIIGTAGVGLGLLNGMRNGSGGILGLGGSDCYSRYDAGKDAEIASLKVDKALLESTIFVKSQMNDLRSYTDSKLDGINTRLAEMAVREQANKDSFLMLQQSIQREKDERCYSDSAIVNYVNATFCPKLVADVTAASTTTAQSVYNPLPACNCNCGC